MDTLCLHYHGNTTKMPWKRVAARSKISHHASCPASSSSSVSLCSILGLLLLHSAVINSTHSQCHGSQTAEMSLVSNWLPCVELYSHSLLLCVKIHQFKSDPVCRNSCLSHDRASFSSFHPGLYFPSFPVIPFSLC